MACPDIMDLERYVLHELDESARASAAEHLGKCAACAQQVAELDENLRLAPSLRRGAHVVAGCGAPAAEGASRPDVEDWFHHADAPPETVGPYRILRKVGEGGMGSVYEAQQENPRRTVALKMIRPGLVSGALLARFRHEAQVLGRLRHPGIAQIYEAGTHQPPRGAPQPYFAMELVHGLPLARYCEAKHLGVRARLELVARVCDAVEHAHQRGVIHRDLKPDNILVDDHGGAGEVQPKILDFGVARVVDPDAQHTTLHTSVGQIVGTVAYMSPEQAAADPAELDTRSDVYALGVICYELLSGRLPYKLNRTNVAESVRAIAHDEPTPLASIDRSLRGDVTTIVGKALEKEKARRYGAAAEMAADIRRHLKDEPITAHPPSTIYQIGKFARRNKGLVAGVALAFVVLVLGIVFTTAAMLRAQHARGLADASAARAGTEAAKQRAVNKFMQDMLAAANPRRLSAADRAAGRNVTVVEAIDQAARKVDAGALAAQPEIELAVRHTLGSTYIELAEHEKATRHIEAALTIARSLGELGRRDVVDNLNSLGIALRAQGKYADAEAAAREALAAARAISGYEAKDIATILNTLGMALGDLGKQAEAAPLLREALDLRTRALGPESAEVATTANNLALLLHQSGKAAEAEPLYRRALDVRRKLLGDHPDVAVSLHNLAALLRDQAKHDEAESLMRDAIAMRGRIQGEDHPDFAFALNSLASLLQARRRFDEAEPLYRRALDVQTRALGDAHPSVAITVNNIATLLRDRGQLAEAEPLFRRSLEIRRKALGERHPAVALVMGNLAGVIQLQGKAAEAEPLFREALAINVERLGADHVETAAQRMVLGNCLTALSRFEEAEGELLRAQNVFDARLPQGNRMTNVCMQYLATLYERWDKPAELAQWTARLSTTRPATQPTSQPTTNPIARRS
jgi:tetratricopeptide (TPR) repeat protein